jgi:hypothetical protein
MALFSQYSIAAAEEALQDAGWAPKTEEELERTVPIPTQPLPSPLLLKLIVKGCLFRFRYRFS